MRTILQAENLEKVYRIGKVDVPALRGVSLATTGGTLLSRLGSGVGLGLGVSRPTLGSVGLRLDTNRPSSRAARTAHALSEFLAIIQILPGTAMALQPYTRAADQRATYKRTFSKAISGWFWQLRLRLTKGVPEGAEPGVFCHGLLPSE